MTDSSIQFVCYFFKNQCINKLFSVIKLPNLINKNTKQYRKPLAKSLEHWGIATRAGMSLKNYSRAELELL